jgi:hemolysin activation/secretion protein
VHARHFHGAIRILLLCCAAGGWGSLSAQQLPPGATPGGVLPKPTEATQQPPPQTELVVPPVSERPLGREEGPRVVVKSFTLVGVSDLGARPNGRAVHEAEVRQVLNAALKGQPQEGFTVNQLQELAGKVADYLHGKGFILAQAFVPAQDVHDGNITIKVLPGKLARIKVEGNKWYSSRTLLRPFNSLLGDVVQKESIESALLTLANYPGLTAFGVLGAGPEVGTTNLTLRVQNEQKVTADASYDNYGSQFAGERRAQLTLGVNDLFGEADRLRVYGLYAYEPGDTTAHGTYGGINYEIPIFSPRDSLLASYSTNYYDIGEVSADIAASNPKGHTAIGELGYRHDLAPSRLGTASFGLALDLKRATFDELGAEIFRDALSTVRANFDWNRTDTRFRGVNQFEIAVEHGFKNLLGAMGDYDTAPGAGETQASRLDASGEFTKGTLNAQRLQSFTTNTSLLLRVQGQYSGDRLVSLEQLSLGGPDAVRAYPVAQALVDSGAVGTAEFIFGVPGLANRPAFANRTWGQVLQFSFFYDYSHGTLNTPNPLGTQDHFNLGGYGAAVQFNIPARVFFRLDVAKPTTSDFVASNGRNPQYFFRLGVSF